MYTYTCSLNEIHYIVIAYQLISYHTKSYYIRFNCLCVIGTPNHRSPKRPPSEQCAQSKGPSQIATSRVSVIDNDYGATSFMISINHSQSCTVIVS